MDKSPSVGGFLTNPKQGNRPSRLPRLNRYFVRLTTFKGFRSPWVSTARTIGLEEGSIRTRIFRCKNMV
jgi:hypothetical protein